MGFSQIARERERGKKRDKILVMFKSRPNTRKYQPRAATAASLVHLAEQQNKYIRLFLFLIIVACFCFHDIISFVSCFIFSVCCYCYGHYGAVLYNIISVFSFGGFSVYPCGSPSVSSFSFQPLCS